MAFAALPPLIPAQLNALVYDAVSPFAHEPGAFRDGRFTIVCVSVPLA